MNWMLVAFVFNVAANGEFEAPKMLYRGFPTEDACNFAGEHFREEFVLPERTKSASICIDKAAFDAKDWQILESAAAAMPPAGEGRQPPGLPRRTSQM